MRKIVLIILTAGLIIVIFFTGLFVKKGYFSESVYFLRNYFKTDLFKENVSLKTENESLKAELEKFQIFGVKNYDSKNYLESYIFSTYPFNIKNELFVDRGGGDGAKSGIPVVVKNEIFIGQVAEVFDNFSKIKTIFDSSWQLPVKIGENKINGLFNGGNDPKITLIEKPIKIGDAVFLASKDFPIHLKIGNIVKINESSGGVFKEAIIQAPYNINELESVYILTQY